MQSNNAVWGAEVQELLQQGMSSPRRGVDVGDHPPITPMRSAGESELGHDAFRLYELITRVFIATVRPCVCYRHYSRRCVMYMYIIHVLVHVCTLLVCDVIKTLLLCVRQVSADCKYLQTTISLEVGDEKFTCSGKTLIHAGFTQFMPWQAISTEENMPAFRRDDAYPVDDVRLLERATSPPDYLTEAELITLMEKHGIGTDASISVHINNICERNYVNVGSGRRLKPTPLGIVLVHGYQKVSPRRSASCSIVHVLAKPPIS